MKNYFVTGATGAIGSALIPLLLADPETRVQLLLRAKSPQELAERREELCRFWGIAAEDAPARERIQAWRGDVTLPRFGLEDATYSALAAECTHIVHSAGNVRMNLPIEQARHSSVDSAVNILELANACRKLQKIEFVSTVGVGGRTRGAVPEEWLSGPREFHNTYEQAKAEAEERLRPAVEGGLPLTVHRPSMVVGNATDGRIIHFQIFYHLCEFLAGGRTFGLTPDFGRARLDIVPADYVAGVIAWSSQTNVSSGRILHSCSGPEFALLLAPLQEEVRRSFAAGGRRLPTLIHSADWPVQGHSLRRQRVHAQRRPAGGQDLAGLPRLPRHGTNLRQPPHAGAAGAGRLAAAAAGELSGQGAGVLPQTRAAHADHALGS